MSSLDFYFPMAAIIITLTFFVILGIFVSFFTSAITKEDEVLRLLKATKAPKAAPKSSSLLALFGFALLLGCYYIALTVCKENLEKILLPVVAMAVLATYLLFAQFNIWLIKILKKIAPFISRKQTFFGFLICFIKSRIIQGCSF